MKIILAILSIILIIFMAEITQNIYDYGFDKSLNKITPEQTLPLNEIEAVRNSLLQSGIDVNTVNGISSGNFERNDFHWFTLFESVDGYIIQYTETGTGSNVVPSQGLQIQCSDDIGDNAKVSKYSAYSGLGFTFSKNMKIKTSIRVPHGGNQSIFIGRGDMNFSSKNGNKIGFYVSNITLYGINANGSDYTVIPLGVINDTSTYVLEAKMIAGISVEYFVNDISIGTSTTNIPIGTGNASYIFQSAVETGDTAVKEVYIGFYDFWQAN